ncbi:MAG: peptidase [Rhodospirillaceae bacterium]
MSNRHRHFRVATSAALAVCAIFAALVAAAEGDDHDRARAAVEAGRTRPLTEILETVRRDFPGEVIDVELEEGHHGRFHGAHAGGEVPIIYDIKVRTAEGRILKLCYDAHTGILRAVHKR